MKRLTAMMILMLLPAAAGAQQNAQDAQNYMPQDMPAEKNIAIQDRLPVQPEARTPFLPVYRVGISDKLRVHILKPEEYSSEVMVSPDGTITVPYIGIVYVRERPLEEIQAEVQKRLAEGYLRYPVVSVSLIESRSRKFYVYGEVTNPGEYPLEENMTVLRAVTLAGGFTKFGSSSRVKVLRAKKNAPGYDPIKINIKTLMEGEESSDIPVQPGDIVVVSQGIF